METSSAQHVQSMVAAMAELTCQNQELRMEINLRRQAREEHEEEDKHRVMLIEKILKLEVSYEAPLHEWYHT